MTNQDSYYFYECYLTLDLAPGSDWKAVKDSYKKLAHSYHPDRNQDSSEESLKASNKKFLLIQDAYNKLAEFRKKNGRMPYSDNQSSESFDSKKPSSDEGFISSSSVMPKGQPSTQEPEAANLDFETHLNKLKSQRYFGQQQASDPITQHGIPPENTSGQADFTYRSKSPNHSTYNASELKTSQTRDPKLLPTAALLTMIVISVVVFSLFSGKNETRGFQLLNRMTETTETSAPIKPEFIKKPAKVEDHRHQNNPAYDFSTPTTNSTFTYGDSIETVMQVQGPPDATNENIWLYGNSEIIFEEGRVKSWESKPPYPLKTDL